MSRRLAFLVVLTAVACSPGPDPTAECMRLGGCDDGNPPLPSSLPVCDLSRGETLEARLEGCTYLRDQIVWIQQDGVQSEAWLRPYVDWDEAMKAQLDAWFEAYLAGRAPRPSCPDPTTAYLATDSTGAGLLATRDQAFDIFTAHVAHALWIEATHAVPWSLVEFDPASLRYLFDATVELMPLATLIQDHTVQRGDLVPYTAFDPDHDYKFVWGPLADPISARCDPRDGWEFAMGRNTIGMRLSGPNPRATLRAISDWAGRNVLHGPFVADPGARSLPYLRDRLRARTPPGDLRSWGAIATFGCHSAARIVADLARSMNVPLIPTASTLEWETGRTYHAALIHRWRGDERLLVHVDDLYANNLEDHHPIDARGEPLDPELGSRAFFDHVWMTPAEAESYGFTLGPDLVVRGEELGLSRHSAEVGFQMCSPRFIIDPQEMLRWPGERPHDRTADEISRRWAACTRHTSYETVIERDRFSVIAETTWRD